LLLVSTASRAAYKKRTRTLEALTKQAWHIAVSSPQERW